MGADIHMVVEKKACPRGKPVWVGVNAFPYMRATVYDDTAFPSNDPNREIFVTGKTHWPATDRNYELFGALAGVRWGGPEPRGVPDDASDLALIMIDGWGEDGHSHTWYSLEEALPIFIRNSQFGDPGEAVLTAMSKGTAHAIDQYATNFWSVDYEENLSDYRLIIWFDN